MADPLAHLSLLDINTVLQSGASVTVSAHRGLRDLAVVARNLKPKATLRIVDCNVMSVLDMTTIAKNCSGTISFE